MEDRTVDMIKLMRERCSCRNFTEEPVTEELLNSLLDASISAPSSGGFQNYAIISVTDKEEKVKLAECCRGQKFIGRAAVNLVFCIDLHRERTIAEAIDAVPDTQLDYAKLVFLTIDAAVAAQNFCIAAESAGLGTVYIGNILEQQKEVARFLKLPEMVIPVIMVTVGWPKKKGVVTKKYPREILVHQGTYEEKDIDLLQASFEKKYEGWKMKPNDRIMSKISKTAEETLGAAYSARNAQRLWDSNYVDPLSFWNGYYYANTDGLMSREEHHDFLAAQGLPFLKK